MRLWIFSDLQLDNPGHRDAPWSMQVPKDTDVAVVAGDVHGPLTRSVAKLATLAAHVPVVYVPGNRDYYPLDGRAGWPGRTMGDLERDAAEAAREAGVTLLMDDTAVVAGVRFFGGTLWPDFNLYGDPVAAVAAAREGMNDYRAIVGDDGRTFTPEAAQARHARTRMALATALASPHAGPTVVVTHLAPHAGSVQARFVDDPMTPSFASDMSDFMDGPVAPDLWVHGGMHHNCDHVVGRTRILSNSRGYPHENLSFDPAMVVDLGARGA